MPASESVLRRARWWAGAAVLAAALVLLVPAVAPEMLRATARAAFDDPLGLAAVVVAYAAAFLLRGLVWRRVLPGIGLGHALAALHTSLAANHLLPLRLGEAVRVTDVVRRARVPVAAATASTVALRAADVLAVLGLAALLAPRALREVLGPWVVPAGVAGTVVLAGAALWLRRVLGAAARGGVMALGLAGAVAAWVLESAVLWRAATWAGIALDPLDAVLVTAVTIAAQVLAVAPGGFGTYEAAATAALVGLGAAPDAALAAAVAAHATKTVYALATGAVAAVVPSPGVFGSLRLPRRLPGPPAPDRPEPDAPVVLFLPAHDEEDTVAEVVRRAPREVGGRPVRVLVVDDGSTDLTASRAEAAGARVVRHDRNLGLGAAVRTGLAEASRMRPAALAFCDADGEYAPEELERLVAPILAGAADYVVGSRFRGEIRRMRPHRRLGNVVLTGILGWVARAPITDGQSGYRALSPAAARDAAVVHDYNYAQVLTLDLLGKGYRYAEVPIGYAFRETGRSFVRLGRYLRHVVPAVHEELNVT
ncbi:MAG: glycosyltransferase [Acidimicrobiia bacterium]